MKGMIDLATGNLIKLGTLYMGGTKQIRPTKPWRNDTVAPGGVGNGDIPNYVASSALEIRNTDASDAYKMQWVEVNDGDKKLLIGDRNALVNISHDDLNALGLITGKKVTIEGQEYLFRVMTGGEEKREGGTGSGYAGGKYPNEWDKYIGNEGSIPGLPTPNASDVDTTPDATDFNGTHNKLWNWLHCYSWVKETYKHDTAYRALRGLFSARSWNYYSSTSRNANFGLRPVLEILNTAPTISGTDEDLGNKNSNFTIDYTVNDTDVADALTIKEKLDGIVTKTITPAQRNFQYAINTDITTLGLGTHTVEIEASDDKGGVSTRTYTFNITAKKYILTLDKNINAAAGDLLTSKDLQVEVNNTALNLVKREDKELTFEGNITDNKVDLKITSKDKKTIKKVVYTVH